MNKIKKILAILVIIAVFIGVTDTVKAYSPPEPDFFHTIYIKPPITNSIIYKSETYLKTKFGRINLRGL